MKQKIGKLESVREIGLFRTLEIRIDGQYFYERIKCEGMPKNINKHIGKKVILNYEEAETPVLFDRIIDALIGLDFKTPIHYNQIKKVKLV